MTEQTETQPVTLKLKTIISIIIATTIVVSGAWAFFFDRTMDLKNEQIAALKNSDPQALNRIEKQLNSLRESIAPLSLAFPFDEFTGRVGLGSGGSGPTKITDLLIKADKFREARKFDLAIAKVEEIRTIRPNFIGAIFMQLLIENDKGNKKEALALAEQLIKKMPDDKRIIAAYEIAVISNLDLGNKKIAEEYCLAAIKLAPEEKVFRKIFKDAFGYETSIPMTKE